MNVKVDFISKKITTDNFHNDKDDIIILHIYALDDRVSKHMKQESTRITGGTE